MSANPPQAATGPRPVALDVQQIMDAYASELAQVTQRAIVAEAGLRQAQAELADARQTIDTLMPRGATEQGEG